VSPVNYETISRFAQQGGALYFGVLFLLVLAYALWPKNKARFEAAAQIPLKDDEEEAR
jgi:cytochrome c oxidase cbb3-type subunit 4